MCVDDHRSCDVLQIPDPFLTDSVLMMGIHSGKGESLVLGSAVLDPLVRLEYSVVGVVVPDYDSSFECITFEGFFSFESFFTCRRFSAGRQS